MWFRWAMVLVITAFAAPVLAGLFFPYAYDDAFISYRITENLIQTGKPWFDPSKSVYTSTSLIYPYWNVIWCLIFGKDWTESMGVVNGFLQSLALARVFWLVKIQCKTNRSFFFAVLAILPLALGQTNIAIANSGLETALYQLVLSCTILGVSPKFLSWFAGMIRPEGFIAGIAVTLGSVFTNDIRTKSILLFFSGVFVFLIWVGLGYLLFDSPFPQSIVAKSNYEPDRIHELHTGFLHVFLQGYGLYTFLIGSTWFFFPEIRKQFLVPLLWLGGYSLFFSGIASWWPWYVPPILIPLFYLSGTSALKWSEYFVARKLPDSYSTYAIGICLSITALEASKSIRRINSQSSAYSIRLESSKKTGQWLDQNIPQGKTILFEPLGLFGYFGRKTKVIDYPGLASREMSDYIKTLPWKIPVQLTDPRTDSAVIGHFQPDYLLLFPSEVQAFNQSASLQKHYTKLDSILYYPLDERFKQVIIYKKEFSPN